MWVFLVQPGFMLVFHISCVMVLQVENTVKLDVLRLRVCVNYSVTTD